MWYLKKTDGVEYGPDELDSIRRWAAESRVVSGNSVSQDRKEWTPVEQVPELEMNWLAEIPDGRRYGPFNIEATKDLVGHKVLPETAKLVHRQTGQALTVREYLDHGVPAAPPSAAANLKPVRPRRNRRKSNDPQGTLWSAPREEMARSDDEVPGAVGADAIMADANAAPDGERQLGSLPAPDDGSTVRAGPDEETDGEAPTPDGNSAARLPPGAGAGAVAGATADEAIETPAGTDDAEGSVDAVLDSQGVGSADDDATALRARVDELAAALATAETRAAAGERALARIKDKAGKVEAELRAELEAVGAEAARRGAQEAQAALAEARSAAEETRGALEAERQAREKAERDRTRVEAEKEQRLAAAVAELKAARADEQAARAALAQGTTDGRKQVTGAEARVKDVLQERNTLAELLEVEAARNRKWKGLALVMAAVWLLTLAGLWFWRGGKTGDETGGGGTASDAGAQAEGQKQTAAPPPAQAPSPAKRPSAVSVRGAAPAQGARTPSSMPTVRGVKGVNVVYDRNGCKIVFDQGVFSSGTNISPWAAGIMRQLAPQLVPNLDRFTLVVEGHTDQSPVLRDSRYGSNEELALSRARAFARYLTQTHGIATTRMKTEAAVNGAPPHPETDNASRARNRTVVLKLVRHAGQ